MTYCVRCLQPDTRPNTVFDSDGVCPACAYAVRLQDVDWNERFLILQEVLASYRQPGFFDCIIGVSGGKDSTRQALFVRDRLGLNPLLVCLSYPPQQVTGRGAANLSNLIDLGFDVLISAPAPETWRRLMRESFFRFTNYGRSTELALFSSVPQIAIRYGIRLILWGENPGLQLGDLKTLGRTGYDGNNLRNMNTLSGGGRDWVLDAGFDRAETLPYRYPTPEEFDEHDLQIVYLGWFLGDWSLIDNGMYSVLNGLEIRDDTPENTGDLYGISALDEDWVTLNQMIKYYKFGFGRATDYVNEGIRLGRLTREAAVDIVERYDGACSDAYVASFCDYIGIDVATFWKQVRSNANTDLFVVGDDIVPRFVVGNGL